MLPDARPRGIDHPIPHSLTWQGRLKACFCIWSKAGHCTTHRSLCPVRFTHPPRLTYGSGGYSRATEHHRTTTACQWEDHMCAEGAAGPADPLVRQLLAKDFGRQPRRVPGRRFRPKGVLPLSQLLSRACAVRHADCLPCGIVLCRYTVAQFLFAAHSDILRYCLSRCCLSTRRDKPHS